MRLVSYRQNDRTLPGLLSQPDGRIFPLEKIGYTTALAFISAGEAAWDAGAGHANIASATEFLSLSDVALVSPLLSPGKFLCIGVNYRDHAKETKLNLPSVPEVFAKFASAIIGNGETIKIPKATTQPDYEAELAVVIGKTCRKAVAEDWQEFVFGYTIVNDVSARDVQFATSQWSMGKSFETFAPIGPSIVTKDEIPDPHRLQITLSIDGEVLQDSNTNQLIFGIPQLIAYLSSIITLEPGDIISTGTPAGVGFGRKPQRWLRPGETMTTSIEGIGDLINPIAAGRE